jgi:hypothetical protein
MYSSCQFIEQVAARQPTRGCSRTWGLGEVLTTPHSKKLQCCKTFHKACYWQYHLKNKFNSYYKVSNQLHTFVCLRGKYKVEQQIWWKNSSNYGHCMDRDVTRYNTISPPGSNHTNHMRWSGNSSWKNSKATKFQKNLIKCCIVDYKNVQITYWNTIISCESTYTVLNTWKKEHNRMFKFYLPTACTNGLPTPPTWNLHRFLTALAHKLLKKLTV